MLFAPALQVPSCSSWGAHHRVHHCIEWALSDLAPTEGSWPALSYCQGCSIFNYRLQAVVCSQQPAQVLTRAMLRRVRTWPPATSQRQLSTLCRRLWDQSWRP